MKLSNLASLDPALKARGRKGLTGASKLDRIVWDEFRENSAVLGPVSEGAFRQLFSARESDDVDLVKGVGVRVRRERIPVPPTGPTEQQATVYVRRGQQFFRQIILNAFEGRCCITGIDLRDLLVASHIMPWGSFPDARLDIQNGLCLSRLHDAAFDKGLITFDDDYRLVLSRELKAHLPHTALEQDFVAYAGQPITAPSKQLGPRKDFLAFHRAKVFRR
jgi:putative restriction endonuclease